MCGPFDARRWLDHTLARLHVVAGLSRSPQQVAWFQEAADLLQAAASANERRSWIDINTNKITADAVHVSQWLDDAERGNWHPVGLSGQFVERPEPRAAQTPVPPAVMALPEGPMVAAVGFPVMLLALAAFMFWGGDD